jgi:hypothetical protein
LVRRKNFFAWHAEQSNLKVRSSARVLASTPHPPVTPGEGGTMELKMRLNVLAAIMSFAFLAAVVFGMI